MSKYFFSASTSGWINTAPNTPVRFQDLNVSNLLMAFVTTWKDPVTGANTQCFQVEMLEGGGSNVNLIRTTYLFPTYGCTLAQFKTILNAQATDINLTTEIYNDMFAIGNKENTLATRDVLVNNSRVVSRLYFPLPSNYTVISLNGGNQISYLNLFVQGQQEDSFRYYYQY